MAQSSDKHAAVLLQFTDTHLHAALDGHMHGVTTQQTFDAALNHAREDSRWPPDAIVVTGDIVQDESRVGYQRFREAFQDFGLPVFCIPGNHDDPTLMAELLMSHRSNCAGTQSWVIGACYYSAPLIKGRMEVR